jgi:hypothetical protein
VHDDERAECERKLRKLGHEVVLHQVLTGAWALCLVLAVVGAITRNVLVILLGVAFVSLCSIYANMMGHWSTVSGKKTEREAIVARLEGDG